jgi:hypothetical protein
VLWCSGHLLVWFGLVGSGLALVWSCGKTNQSLPVFLMQLWSSCAHQLLWIPRRCNSIGCVHPVYCEHTRSHASGQWLDTCSAQVWCQARQHSVSACVQFAHPCQLAWPALLKCPPWHDTQCGTAHFVLTGVFSKVIVCCSRHAPRAPRHIFAVLMHSIQSLLTCFCIF